MIRVSRSSIWTRQPQLQSHHGSSTMDENLIRRRKWQLDTKDKSPISPWERGLSFDWRLKKSKRQGD